MNKLALILACSLSLVGTSACDTLAGGNVPGSSYLANQTKLDEQMGIALTLGYTAASKGAALAITVGLIKNPTTIAAIGRADAKAYALVKAVRSAYLAGNRDTYTETIQSATAAIAELTALFGKPTASLNPNVSYEQALGLADTAHGRIAA